MDPELLPSELLEVVRFSLKATASDFYTLDDDETFNPRNPALRKLVEAVLYSRKFVLTYYAVLAAVILSVAFLRRTRKLLLRHRRPKTEVHTPASFESSNTTLRGDASPDEAGDAERRPLLDRIPSLQVKQHGSVPSLWRWLRSALIYQPRPIPALTTTKNMLPDNGTSAVVVLLIGLNLFYLLFHTELSVPMLFAFADRAGLCFAMNLPILYLLAAKTNQPVQLLTGWTYEGLNIFHRRLGEFMTALAAMHSVGMLGVWYTLLRPLHFSLLRFVSGRVGLLGIFTFVSYLAIYVSSTGWVRRMVYERFLVLHVVLQVSALVFLFFHHSNSRPYVLASFAIWALDRLVIRMGISSTTFIATLDVAADQQTVLLYCEIPITRRRTFGNASIANGWLPSQHVFVTVPGIGYAKHRLQAHPFTIASPAPPRAYCGSWELQLTIRAQDGFSRELLEYAKFHQHTKVIIDGPYGSTDTLEAMETASRVCLVAGGSGIAVTYPLAWELCVEPWADAVLSARTVYEAGQRRTPAISGHEPLGSNHMHMWVRQDARADQWLTSFPRYQAVKGQHQTPMASKPDAQQGGCIVGDIVSNRFETGGIHALRPDVQTELTEWVEGELSTTLKHGPTPARGSEKLVVLVSGPDGLVRDIRNSAASLARKGWDIEVHVEKFGW